MPATPATPDDQAPSVIRVRDLVRTFDGRAVLDGITLDVRRGEIIVIMGGSGCGKSTLLRHLIGSLQPSSGTIELLGHDITHMTEEQLAPVRKRIGILFQSGALFNSMTLRQNVALPLEEHTDLPGETIEIIVTIKLELVGLREHADKFPAQISGGMKKRAGLARALALDPEVLFYDEPSAGLDPVTSAEIDELILNLTRQLGVTSVVVTHEMDSAFRIADRMAMLDAGRMLCVSERAFFEHLRDTKEPLDEGRALIRQFLRGDPHGPITDRRQTTGYAAELLGEPEAAPAIAPRVSVQSTRDVDHIHRVRSTPTRTAPPPPDAAEPAPAATPASGIDAATPLDPTETTP